MWSRVDQHQVSPAPIGRFKCLGQASGRNGNDNRLLGLATIFPPGRACLGVEIDHHGSLFGLLSRNREMQRKGGFPGTTLLAQDRNRPHWPSCSIAILPAMQQLKLPHCWQYTAIFRQGYEKHVCQIAGNPCCRQSGNANRQTANQNVLSARRHHQRLAKLLAITIAILPAIWQGAIALPSCWQSTGRQQAP